LRQYLVGRLYRFCHKNATLRHEPQQGLNEQPWLLLINQNFECVFLATSSLAEELRKSNGVANFLKLTWIVFDYQYFLEKIWIPLWNLSILVD
jgi:hypothetical protein